jgi:hypothetical protein
VVLFLFEGVLPKRPHRDGSLPVAPVLCAEINWPRFEFTQTLHGSVEQARFGFVV